MVVMKKAILTLLLLVFFLTFASATYLRFNYTRCMPETPQIQDGRTIPMDVFYGKTVYVTLRGKRKLEALVIALVIEVAMYVFLGLKFAKKQ